MPRSHFTCLDAGLRLRLRHRVLKAFHCRNQSISGSKHTEVSVWCVTRAMGLGSTGAKSCSCFVGGGGGAPSELKVPGSSHPVKFMTYRLRFGGVPPSYRCRVAESICTSRDAVSIHFSLRAWKERVDSYLFIHHMLPLQHTQLSLPAKFCRT